MSDQIFHDNNKLSDSMNLLISILVCYPEIAALHLNSKENIIRFTFIIKKSLDSSEEEFNDFKKQLSESIQTYSILEQKELDSLHIFKESYDNITLIKIERDIHTFSQGELSLLVQILNNYYPNLNNETEEYSLTEYSHKKELKGKGLRQEKMISNMLKKMRHKKYKKNVVGFWDDGRVLVFDKK